MIIPELCVYRFARNWSCDLGSSAPAAPQVTWCASDALKKLCCLFYGPYFMASPVNLPSRRAFAPSYYCVFHCLASCLRQIGFPTGGINKDNPIADSISSREGWWRPAAALLGGKYVKKKRLFLGPRESPSTLARSEKDELYLLPPACQTPTNLT